MYQARPGILAFSLDWGYRRSQMPDKAWQQFAFDTYMDEQLRVRLGARLKGLRVEKGLHQADLAEQAGISIGTLQGIEGGQRNTRAKILNKVASALGTTVQQLIREGVDPQVQQATLNREDLLIAWAYHNAVSVVRNRAR